MDDAELRRRFAASPVARLATIRPGGGPHLVPVVFALVGEMIYTCVDDKPKRSRRLQRLANIGLEPRCSLIVDHYDEDWSRLWWVRADGTAVIMEPITAPAALTALAGLAAKYPQYRDRPPAGPLIAIQVRRWTGWSASN